MPIDRDHDREREPGERLWRLGTRAAVLAIPLALVGWLLAALGLPYWLAGGAMLVALVIVVFEIDL